MLANYECDLHGHTNRSDGNDSPVEYIRHAVHRGVKILAITDHDIVPPEMIELGGGKRQEITAYAKGIGVELLRGIEISCETYIDDVHLVCLGCDWNAPYFKELDEFTINSKVNSYRKLIDLLNEQGMEMTWEEVLQNNGYPVQEQFVQKKMIFELMARKGYMESWKEAKLYVKNSKEVSVKREKPDAVSVIKEIHKLGGIIMCRIWPRLRYCCPAAKCSKWRQNRSHTIRIYHPYVLSIPTPMLLVNARYGYKIMAAS